jgi:hypothetical protein
MKVKNKLQQLEKIHKRIRMLYKWLKKITMHNLIKNKKFIFEFDYDSLFYYNKIY